jgi:hypothetical protein
VSGRLLDDGAKLEQRLLFERPSNKLQAVRQAVRDGHDETGRFWSAVPWALSQPAAPGRSLLPAAAGWTEWELTAGGPAADDLLVVRQAELRLLGLGLAVLVSEGLLRGMRLVLPAWFRAP